MHPSAPQTDPKKVKRWWFWSKRITDKNCNGVCPWHHEFYVMICRSIMWILACFQSIHINKLHWSIDYNHLGVNPGTFSAYAHKLTTHQSISIILASVPSPGYPNACYFLGAYLPQCLDLIKVSCNSPNWSANLLFSSTCKISTFYMMWFRKLSVRK